jgi:hypothetical protein
MDVSIVKRRNYNNEQRTMNCELLFKTNPIKPNFKGKKILLRLTINGWREAWSGQKGQIENRDSKKQKYDVKCNRGIVIEERILALLSVKKG